MDRIAFKWDGENRLEKGVYYISDLPICRLSAEIKGIVELRVEDYDGGYVDTLRFEHLIDMELGSKEYIALLNEMNEIVKTLEEKIEGDK